MPNGKEQIPPEALLVGAKQERTKGKNDNSPAERKPSPISFKEKASRLTERPLEFYESLLGINDLEALRGKRILNIGAGGTKLAETLREKGIKTMVVSLDLAYKDIGKSDGRWTRILTGKALKKKDIPENAVAADMKRLPFAPESFDVVLALYSVGWLPTRDQPAMVEEIARVTKEGGKILIYPFLAPAKDFDDNFATGVELKTPEISLPALGSLLSAGIETPRQESAPSVVYVDNITPLTIRTLRNLEYLGIEAIQGLWSVLKGKKPTRLKIIKEKSRDYKDFAEEAIRNGAEF